MDGGKVVGSSEISGLWSQRLLVQIFIRAGRQLQYLMHHTLFVFRHTRIDKETNGISKNPQQWENILKVFYTSPNSRD